MHSLVVYVNKIWNGKIYNKNGEIECEIKDGKGYIKEYDYFILGFKGEYLNVERNGKGIQYYKENLKENI